MNTNKAVFIIFLAVFSMLFTADIRSASAASVEELQALIAQLQAQILQLQQQLAATQGQPAAWCYNFTTNLRFGDGGGQSVEKEPDVRNLQIALEKEGFAVSDQEKKGGSVFEESTASAIVGFQQKYKQEVLAPYGLNFGTGFVGSTTRAKLNKLYGCGVAQTTPLPVATPSPTPVLTPVPTAIPTSTLTPTPVPTSTPSITVLSPNGGEELFQGVSYSITWQPGTSFDRVSIYLDKANLALASDVIIENVSNTGFYTWTVGSVVAGSYKIRVCEYRDPTSAYYAVACDSSNSYFNIAKSSALSAPEMEYPVNGQTLNHGYPHGYMFKVKPVAGASGYLFGFFQNGVMVYENWRDNRTLSKNGEFAVWPDNPFYSKFKEGNVEVWVRTWINNQWSEARVITIKLVAPVIASSTPTAPVITRPTSVSAGQSASYSFMSIAKGPSSLDFFITWGDGTLGGEDCIAHSAIKETMDGTQTFMCNATHIYSQEGTYTIEAMASDLNVANWSAKGVLSVKVSAVPSITVLSPNGGETWVVGDIYNIAWNAKGVDAVTLWLADFSTPSITWYRISPDLSDLAVGKYSWKVGTCYGSICNFSAGDKYKVKVEESASSSRYPSLSNDESDNYFSIVSATPSITVSPLNPNNEILEKGTTRGVNMVFSPSVPQGGFVVNLIESDAVVAVAHLKTCGTAADYTKDNVVPPNVTWQWNVGYDADGKAVPDGSYRILVYDCGSKADNVWTGSKAQAKSGIFTIASGSTP